MAIYHLSAKVIKRSAGRSSVAAAAYRAGERLVDERTGLVHDYSRRSRRAEMECFIEAPEGAPSWARNREELWNRVEAAERRRDSQVAREVEVALPKELSREGQRELVAGYVRESFVSRGMLADVAIHWGDPNNPHAHVLLTTREVGPEGFGGKAREWNGRELLGEWREGWERHANRELERAGYLERVDHRSYAERGIEREPTRHEGPAVREMEARGIRTERGELNRAAGRRNAKREREPGRKREPERELERGLGREWGRGVEHGR